MKLNAASAALTTLGTPEIDQTPVVLLNVPPAVLARVPAPSFESVNDTLMVAEAVALTTIAFMS